MPQFFLNKRLIILLVSLIILVSLIGFSLKDKENISKPEQFLKDVVGFGQSLVSRPANGVANFFENIEDVKNTYMENKKLKSRLEGLAKLEKEIVDLKKDNAELRNVLKKTDDLREYDTIQATVISRNPERWDEKFIINRGTKSGVDTEMAVITSKGLVGKVTSVSAMTATVELLTSENTQNRVSAEIQGKDDIYGLINGYDSEKKLLLMKDIPVDKKIKEGQNVITSGLGGIFPKTLDIGKVKSIEMDRFGLTQIAYIEPSAHFYDFEHVMVVVRTMGKQDNLDKGEE